MKLITPILVAVLITAGILTLSGKVSEIGITVSENTFINFQLNYQLLLLGLALLSMVCSYLLNPESFKSVLSFGNISAIGEELKIFGIKKWRLFT